MNDREPSNDLLRGRRALDGVPELRLREDFKWHPDERRWVLRVEVRLDVSSPHLRATSQWVVLLEDEYPLGSVKVYPAREGGVVATFPHQARNALYARGACVADRSARASNPRSRRSAPSRARQNLRTLTGASRGAHERLVAGGRRAAPSALQADGDPFELPEPP